jgi:predicted 2-oxoglutarate/Fe(II)-dependent dioxygenase YbiX
MLFEIPDVFTRDEAAAMHEALIHADWLDAKAQADIAWSGQK